MTGMRMRSLAMAAVAALALGAACGRGERAPDAAVIASPTAKVDLATFGRLRWLEGRWSGAEAGGAPFYEAYAFINDSTIRQYEYADSAMATPKDSGLIVFRGDSVVNGWPTVRYRATRVDSATAEFVRVGNESQGFVWSASGPGAWTAKILWDSAGIAKSRIYEMRLIP